MRQIDLGRAPLSSGGPSRCVGIEACLEHFRLERLRSTGTHDRFSPAVRIHCLFSLWGERDQTHSSIHAQFADSNNPASAKIHVPKSLEVP